VGQDLGVAGIGCLTAEHGRRPSGAAEQLVEQCQLDLAVTLPAHLRLEVGGPQPLLPHLLLERAHDRQGPVVGLVVGIAEHIVERLHVLPQEPVDPVQLLLVFRLGLEVPPHGADLNAQPARGAPSCS
jgi:hypothetical protein